ncbi:MAG: hypothetical protein HYX67_11140 [Candidatus Melainabacteria bacterium]|nr:hypothetical protein [Candidatus Melainabacteria bacterium]
MRKIRTRFTEPLVVDAATVVVQGDLFSGYSSYLAPLDLERYIDAEPRDLGASDPFASWIYRGPDSTKFVVGQPPFKQLVVERPKNDPWAEFFAGKGPRPIKLSPDDGLPMEPVTEAQAERNLYSSMEVDAFTAGAGPFFPGSDSDSFSSSGSLGWVRGDAFSSSPHTVKRNYWRKWTPSPQQKPGTFIAAKGESARAGVLPEPRWADSNVPLRVYISGTVAAARGGLVSQEIKTALREWRRASNGRLQYVLTDQYVAADIVFVCETTRDNQWAENITEYHNSMFDRVRVSLLEETLLKLDPKRVRGLCLHEVGHAFGIRNHSKDKRDAMSLAATDDSHPVLGLSENDRRLIAKLYP